jgi:hypothetical protein
VWNERFTFARAGTEGNELILRIWNANALTSDKCIGSATVRLDAVFKNETDDVDVEVLDTKGRPSGVLNLVLTFTPDTSETRRRANAPSNGAYVVQQQQQPTYVVQQQQQPTYVVQQQRQQQPTYVVQQQQQQQPMYVMQQPIPQTNGGAYMRGGLAQAPQQVTPNVTYVQLPSYPVQQAPQSPPGYVPTPIGGFHENYAGGGGYVIPPPPGWSNAPQPGYAQYDDDEWGA